ncbi:MULTISPECIES: glutathione S-transferase N-terminal domain-containing protein [unclassified Pseudomonas]|uniref:glutathione S-transferase N-terminal domain-containing protein n=1 Tax=unclassified Pseudomonas TaxID=196821 RepID=UPI0015A449CE|nr:MULTISPECIES: glutathione S-transferase [unclassified Pseudomonas]NWC96021.1 glutathione S-transferase [Pseudomonas sp. IPO3779]NWD20372.1 glutathione S-transferase [Pseudomonas sp. IPO3778]
MYTLYGTQGTGSCIIEIALQRCSVEWRQVDACSWEHSAGSEALARINPLKQIPTLQLPDGSVLTESAAILIHLGLQFPASGLLPEAPTQVIRGLVYIAANCYSAIGIIDYPERWTDSAEAQQHEQLVSGTRRRLHGAWEVFADQFADQLFTPAQGPNALGVMAAAVSRWAGGREALQQSRPGFARVLAQVDTDPDVAPVFARHWPR